MRLIIVLLLAAGCGGSREARLTTRTPPPEPVAETARYELAIAAGEPGWIRMTLWLAAASADREIDLPDIAGRDARRERINDLACGDQRLLRSAGGWTLPSGCDRLTWSVAAEARERTGADPSAQLAVRDGEADWWFAPGAAVFLAPTDWNATPQLELDLPEGTAVHHALEPAELGDALQLPPGPRLGRVFLGVGQYETMERSDGHATITHAFAGTPPDDAAELLSTYTEIATYLSAVIGRPGPRKLLVLWFPRDAAARSAAGAAGEGAIATTYLVGALPQDTPAVAEHAGLLVLAHEHFHVVAGGAMPAWVGESLAQYFALLALTRTGLIDDDVRRGFIGDLSESEEPPVTLLAAEERHARGDPSVTDLFYRFGVRFWAEIDHAIVDASDGERDLGDLLEELLNLGYGEDGTPPQRFLSLLRDAGAADVGAVATRYLGWPGER